MSTKQRRPDRRPPRRLPVARPKIGVLVGLSVLAAAVTHGPAQAQTVSAAAPRAAVANGRAGEVAAIRLQASPPQDPEKARLVLHHQADAGPLSLKTRDGKVPVLDSVAAGSSAAREVKPVKVWLAVFDGDAKLADAEPVVLEPGKSFNLLVSGSAEQPVLEWVVP